MNFFGDPFERIAEDFPVGSHWRLREDRPFHLFQQGAEYEVTGYCDMAAPQAPRGAESLCYIGLTIRRVMSGFEQAEQPYPFQHAVGPYDFSRRFERVHIGEPHSPSSEPAYTRPEPVSA